MPTTIEEFESVWPRVKSDILNHCQQYGLPQEALDWFSKQLDYNTAGGKRNRGTSVVDTVVILQNHSLHPSSEEFFHTALLGWLVELLQAFFLVSDDITDASTTRRGHPCWYLVPQVGMIAINDSCMIESCIYFLLKKYFRQEESYITMVELFHEVTFQTEIGQLYDTLTAPADKVDLGNFNKEKFTFIAIYKTAYYSFYLPVALAIHYLGLATEKNLQAAHDILIPMGEYFQAQDDYLDAFGKTEILGKIGTDIEDNKCSWLITQALGIANNEQRRVLEENYGRRDAKNEAKARVKAIYDELRLHDVYLEWESRRYEDLKAKIEELDESCGLKEVFDTLLGKIHQRQK